MGLSIIDIANRLRRLPLHHQIAHLRALVRTEKRQSIRRTELEGLLRVKMSEQLRREIRAGRKSA